MRTHRRGLTVIELVLILVVLGIVVFFLLRLRGGDDAPAAGAALGSDSAVAAPPTAAAGALATRLALVAPLDSSARAGDTLLLRVRATNEGGVGVAGAALSFAAEGGGRAEPAAATANDVGDAEARWVLGAVGAQTLRVSIAGSVAEPLVLTLPLAGAGAP